VGTRAQLGRSSPRPRGTPADQCAASTANSQPHRDRHQNDGNRKQDDRALQRAVFDPYRVKNDERNKDDSSYGRDHQRSHQIGTTHAVTTQHSKSTSATEWPSEATPGDQATAGRRIASNPTTVDRPFARGEVSKRSTFRRADLAIAVAAAQVDDRQRFVCSVPEVT
jgi:hypothetical protein